LVVGGGENETVNLGELNDRHEAVLRALGLRHHAFLDRFYAVPGPLPTSNH